MRQQEIADEIRFGQSTVADIIGDSSTGKSDKAPETESEPQIDPVKSESAAVSEAVQPEIPEADESPVEEKLETTELGPQPETDEISAAEQAPAVPDSGAGAGPPESILDDILNTVRAVMGTSGETRRMTISSGWRHLPVNG